MKRPAVLLGAMAATLILASGVALAATVVDCSARSFCTGTPGNDDMKGSNSGQEMHGLGGDDILRGFGGSDLLRGGLGNDRLKGGSGEDIYRFEDDWKADVVSDPSGYDSLDFSLVTTPVEVKLIPRTSRPEARSGENTVNIQPETVVEQAQGGLANDSISGNSAYNSLEGDEGNDYINGRGGADGIGGGRGNDTLVGGLGRDIIFGRSGDDTIYVADGEADEVSCAAGADTVYFDPDLDTIKDCETQNPAQ